MLKKGVCFFFSIWYQEIKATDGVIAAKALELAAALVKTFPPDSMTPEIQAFASGNFKASSGYLANWKNRYGLVWNRIFVLS